MKLKNLGVLLLLSLTSVYFICPVQCAAIREVGVGSVVDKVMGHHHHQMGSQAAGETNESACCQSENRPSPSRAPQDEGQGHCCFDRWELLGTLELQSVLQIQKETFSLVVLHPTPFEIVSRSISFTVHLQYPHTPYTVPSIPQCSPRSPPFSPA